MNDNCSNGRDEDGRFAAGVSGNPKGRPKGARNRATLWDQALREGRARQLLDDAAEGDTVALRFCVDRIEPKSRERYVEIRLGHGEERHPRVVFDAVTRALCNGKLSIADALAIARYLALRDNIPSSWLSREHDEEPVVGLSYAQRDPDDPAADPPPEEPDGTAESAAPATAEPAGSGELVLGRMHVEQARDPVSGVPKPVFRVHGPPPTREEWVEANFETLRRALEENPIGPKPNPVT
jgi:hypothetical protein